MLIKIETRHFASATDFGDTHTCPLAMALREKFPTSHILVGGLTVDIDDKMNIGFVGWMERHDSPKELINSYILYAKEGRDVPTFEVELIDYEPNKN